MGSHSNDGVPNDEFDRKSKLDELTIVRRPTNLLDNIFMLNKFPDKN